MILAQVPSSHGGPGFLGPPAGAGALSAALVYLLAATRLRRRGDSWPLWRDASFVTGCAALAYAGTGALPGGPFTVHMAQHLAVAMAAPLLLVLARPLTLALRALPAGPVRRGLLAVAHSRPATWLIVPPVAAALDISGMWLLYRTPLLSAAHHQPALNALVHVHVLAVGLLFTSAVCQLDPVRRRWHLAWRGIALLAAGWAHGVLAKSLYATPPPGTAVSTADLHTAAQLMYYGGDLVEVGLAAVLAAHWYTTAGRRDRRSTAPRSHPHNRRGSRSGRVFLPFTTTTSTGLRTAGPGRRTGSPAPSGTTGDGRRDRPPSRRPRP